MRNTWCRPGIGLAGRADAEQASSAALKACTANQNSTSFQGCCQQERFDFQSCWLCVQAQAHQDLESTGLDHGLPLLQLLVHEQGQM